MGHQSITRGTDDELYAPGWRAKEDLILSSVSWSQTPVTVFVDNKIGKHHKEREYDLSFKIWRMIYHGEPYLVSVDSKETRGKNTENNILHIGYNINSSRTTLVRRMR